MEHFLALPRIGELSGYKMDYSTIMVIMGSGAAVILLIFLSQVKIFRTQNLRDAADAYEKNEIYRAYNILQKLVGEDPRNPLILWYLARVHIKMEKLNEAIEDLTQILQINKFTEEQPDLPMIENYSEIEVRIKLRELLLLTNSVDLLFNETQKLMVLDPQNIEYPLSLAKILFKKQEYSERTLNYIKAALEVDPDHLDSLSMVAIVYFKSGKLDLAEKFAKRTLELNEGLLDSKYILGEVALARNETEEAKILLTTSCKSLYYGKSAKYALVRIFAQANDWETALTWAQDSDKTASSAQEPETLEWDVKYQLGRIFEHLADKKKALETFKIIAQHNPTYRDVSQRLKTLEVTESDDTDDMKDFQTANLDQFKKICEKLIEIMGYQIEKLYITNDGNVNASCVGTADVPLKYGIFIRRNFDVIQEDQPRLLKRYMDSNRCSQGVLATTGLFSEPAKKTCQEYNINMVDQLKLERYLNDTFARMNSVD